MLSPSAAPSKWKQGLASLQATVMQSVVCRLCSTEVMCPPPGSVFTQAPTPLPALIKLRQASGTAGTWELEGHSKDMMSIFFSSHVAESDLVPSSHMDTAMPLLWRRFAINGFLSGNS